MMNPIRKMEIAVIGDADLVNGMRLAGVRRYHQVQEEHEPAREIREVLGKLMAEPDVGIIVLLEEYVQHVRDLIAQVRESKRLTPVVLEVPSRQGSRYGDARNYYREYIRGFIGFDIEI
jgi:vacuolar-type H+-ATPase subunit F/Vma7